MNTLPNTPQDIVAVSATPTPRVGKGVNSAVNYQMWKGPLSGLHPVLPALFLLQNLFNPFSPYLTLAFNICLLIVLLMRNRLRVATVAPIVIVAAIMVLVWLCVVYVIRGDVETHVLLKYLRTTATIVVLTLIFGSFKSPEPSFVRAMNLVLSFHILLIALQVLWPNISIITAPIFGFERESSIIEQYAMRKLGASSGYDTASIFSIAGLLFFILQYLRVRRPIFLLAVIVAFVAALMSSRAGMAVALLVLTFFSLRLILLVSIGWKCVAIAGISVIATAVYILLVPLFLHSLGVSALQQDDLTVVFAATDYGTTGTLEALTRDHLEPLSRPLQELILGYGVDPNTIGKITDIGYVKLIYHVGIVGTLIIIFLHFYMLANLYIAAKYAKPHSDNKLLAIFLLFFILIALVFNYKTLEIYSRGVGDFIFLLFLYLARMNQLKNKHPTTISVKNNC